MKDPTIFLELFSEQNAREKREMALEEAVLEYLQHNDLEQTARSFSAECATRGVALNSGGAGAGGSATLTNAERQELVSKILALFDAGRRAEFIELWDRHIPSRLQRSAARIGFFTSVFFAIWPIHPSNPHRSVRRRIHLPTELTLLHTHTQTARRTGWSHAGVPGIHREQERGAEQDARVSRFFCAAVRSQPRQASLVPDFFHRRVGFRTACRAFGVPRQERPIRSATET